LAVEFRSLQLFNALTLQRLVCLAVLALNFVKKRGSHAALRTQPSTLYGFAFYLRSAPTHSHRNSLVLWKN
jgi:hypothetical protein